jgi:biopolymer transport protein ExbD
VRKIARHGFAGGAVKLDMTPMIDCVFNLLVFFILVVDLGQRELESVTLPRASEFVKDDASETGRKVVNLDLEGEIRTQRRPVTLDQLRVDLKIWSDQWPGSGSSSSPSRRTRGASARPRLRARRDAEGRVRRDP